MSLEKLNYAIDKMSEAQLAINECHKAVTEEELMENEWYDLSLPEFSKLDEMQYYLVEMQKRVENTRRAILTDGKSWEELKTEEFVPEFKGDFLNIQETKYDEINKVFRRVPKWRKKPNQINHRILDSFLKLQKENDRVTLNDLCQYCVNSYEDINEHKFRINYNQMVNIAPKNSGKVFENQHGKLTLWEPVAEFIKTEWEK